MNQYCNDAITVGVTVCGIAAYTCSASNLIRIKVDYAGTVANQEIANAYHWIAAYADVQTRRSDAQCRVTPVRHPILWQRPVSIDDVGAATAILAHDAALLITGENGLHRRPLLHHRLAALLWRCRARPQIVRQNAQAQQEHPQRKNNKAPADKIAAQEK